MSQAATAADAVNVSIDDFVRAESDKYMGSFAKNGLGKLTHVREAVSIDAQTVIRMNRDTLYSDAVCDLDAGPVTIRLPEPGKRYQALQAISQDHLTKAVFYGPGEHTFTRDGVGTRYVLFLVRTLADPEAPADMAAAHALQDQLALTQAAAGKLELPNWNQDQLTEIRDALKILGRHTHGTERTFGDAKDIDPVHHLIGTAIGWGGNPDSAAQYINVNPPQNDGKVVHRLRLKDVPVDGFWSVSLYNADGFFQKNARNAYSINDLTATPDPDGGVTIQFGGCDDGALNCLPIMPGWNYILRLYRPRQEVLDGRWTPPDAEPVPAA